MTGILSIILLVFGVLQIILFFKLWGMTNDVRSIRAMMEKTPFGGGEGQRSSQPRNHTGG